MNALLRLYPRAWRERYGDELVAMLEEHPTSLLDQIDLIRGALDARLHPQVPGVATPPDKELPMHQRQLGVLAAIGGIVWVLAVASFFVLTAPGRERQDMPGMLGLAIGMAMIGIPLGELGTRRDSTTSTRTGHIIAAVGVGLASTMIMPWPLMGIAFFGFPPLAIAAIARGVVNGAFPAWFAIVPVAAIAGMFAATVLLGEAGPWSLALVGLAGLVLSWLAFRGTPTDDPAVRAA